jgi:hypothetical protein
MKLSGIVAGVVLTIAATVAQAQYVQPQVSPYGNMTYSPYVNLLQSGNGTGGAFNPAITYMGIVQPQLQAQSNFMQLQNQINLTRAMPNTVAPPRNNGVADTGYAPARFLQYQQYFNTLSTQGRMNSQSAPGNNLPMFGQR